MIDWSFLLLNGFPNNELISPVSLYMTNELVFIFFSVSLWTHKSIVLTDIFWPAGAHSTWLPCSLTRNLGLFRMSSFLTLLVPNRWEIYLLSCLQIRLLLSITHYWSRLLSFFACSGTAPVFKVLCPFPDLKHSQNYLWKHK